MTSRFSRRGPGSVYSFVAFGVALVATPAHAEKVLVKEGNWEVYSDGRAGAFVSYVRGDGLPQSSVDSAGYVHDIVSGGFDAAAERHPGPNGELDQGKIESMRVRSGFVSNLLGFGVRTKEDGVTYSGYIQIWATVETESRYKTFPVLPDIRQGYAKVEGPWGYVLAGRSRALMSRGATDIDAMYAHRYGVGFPGRIDSNGPAVGQIGFGVLGSGFAPGIQYGTPVLGGFQLTVGVFDPVQLQGTNWTRTKYVRPEGEATFERPISDLGKFVLFLNGTYQDLHETNSPESNSVSGFGAGGRLELGPVHLGVAGHYGKGLGLAYALESSTATQGNPRKYDGYYAQSQVVVGPTDIFAGAGIARVFLNPADRQPDPVAGIVVHSLIRYQMGINAGFVWHIQPWLHFDVDGFRAEAKWFGSEAQPGEPPRQAEKQVIYVANTGMTVSW